MLLVMLPAAWICLCVRLMMTGYFALAGAGLFALAVISGIGYVRRKTRIVWSSIIAGAIGGAVSLTAWAVLAAVTECFWPQPMQEGMTRMQGGALVILVFSPVVACVGLVSGAVIGLLYGVCAWDTRRHGLVYRIRPR